MKYCVLPNMLRFTQHLWHGASFCKADTAPTSWGETDPLSRFWDYLSHEIKINQSETLQHRDRFPMLSLERERNKKESDN